MKLKAVQNVKLIMNLIIVKNVYNLIIFVKIVIFVNKIPILNKQYMEIINIILNQEKFAQNVLKMDHNSEV